MSRFRRTHVFFFCEIKTNCFVGGILIKGKRLVGYVYIKIYITLSNIQNGVLLNPATDKIETALSEILYWPALSNISWELGNNKITNGDDLMAITIFVG